MPASRDEFIVQITTNNIPITFEAHYDPETELWVWALRRGDRIVEVGKCERAHIWDEAKTEIESCVMLHHDETSEPTSALDGVEPEAQA